MIELLVVLVAMICVLAIIVPRVRRGRGAGSLGGLRRYGAPDALPGYLGGVLATFAVASFTTAVGTLTATSIAVGVLVGLGWVVANLHPAARAIFVGVVASLGIVGTVIGFVADTQCGGAPLSVRLVSLAALAGAAVAGIFVAGMTGRPGSVAALAGFASVEILAFLASPLGISIVDTSGWGVGASILIAALFGFFAFVAPKIVMGLGAIAAGLATVGAAAMFGTACGGGEWGALGAVAAFSLTYLAASSLARLVRR